MTQITSEAHDELFDTCVSLSEHGEFFFRNGQRHVEITALMLPGVDHTVYTAIVRETEADCETNLLFEKGIDGEMRMIEFQRFDTVDELHAWALSLMREFMGAINP